jgi:Ribbon-helix-helix protein, copG family
VTPLQDGVDVRLSEAEMTRLHALAAREHRSVHEVVRLAVLRRIEDGERRERVLALTDRVMEDHAHTLERLGEL